ncbi:MAG: hypothetical protein O2971_04125 [Proteobacteria bacterium]|nr:hypothetical protein [Pseudomonadota bacterium]
MPQTDNLHRLNERAEVDLQLIRSMMQRRVKVVPMPGWGIFAIGLIGLITAYFTRNLQSIDWIAAWGIAAIVAVSVALLISNWHIHQSGKSIYVGSYNRFWLNLLPGFFSAALLSGLLIALDHPEFLSALWLLLYGVAVSAAGSHSIPLVRWMGAAFLLLGTVSVFFPSQNLDMALGFGGLHLLFGVLITRANDD